MAGLTNQKKPSRFDSTPTFFPGEVDVALDRHDPLSCNLENEIF